MKNNYQQNIWKIYLFKFLVNLHFFGAVLIPFFTDWGHITFAQVMILQSWFLICAMIMDVPTGIFADRFGRKYALIVATIFNLIGVIVYVSYPSFFIFFIGETLWAIGAAFYSGADQAIMYDTLKMAGKEKESKVIFNRMYNATMLAMAIAAPIGSYIAVNFGLQVPMLLMALPIGLGLIVALTFKEVKLSTTKNKENFWITMKEGFAYFKNHKELKILSWDMIVISSISYFMIWLYQPILMNLNIATQYFGWVHMGLVIAQIAVVLLYKKFEDIMLSKKLLMFIMAALTGISVIVAGLTRNVILAIVSIMLSIAFGMTRKPLFSSYANKFIPSENRATVLSVVSMLNRFVLVVFNPLIGWLADWSLTYTLVGLGIVGLIFSVISGIEEKHLID